MKTRIHIIRHGKSEGNIRRSFQGRDNSELSDLGRRQAERLRDRLADTPVDVVYHSPLKRARRTAEIVFGGRGVPLIEKQGFIERDFGPLDGVTLEEAKKVHPDAEEFYHGRIIDIGLGGVESIEDLRKRSLPTLEEIV
jgi:broad specificity phosphatase PhoE